MTANSVLDYFYDFETNQPDKPYLHQPFGQKWETYTWGEVGQMARKLVTYFESLNLKPQSHISIVSKNCREWIIADLAIMMSGHVSVPFFPTLTGHQIGEVINLGDVDLLFVGKVEVWDDMKRGIPENLHVVTFPHYHGCDKIDQGTSWSEIMDNFAPSDTRYIGPLDDLWTIIFTSGTTGTPKGVMHENHAQKNMFTLFEDKDNPLFLDSNEINRFFSFLPLNHIAERVLVGLLSYKFGAEVYFTESIAQFPDNLRYAKPTIFFAVPRIYTKFMLGVLDKLPQNKLDKLLRIPIISNLIKKKIKKGLGLKKSRLTAVGAAAIAQSTKDWFRSIGLPLSEGYGMTENCASCTTAYVTENIKGSVGRAQKGVELKIHEESGEILMRSALVMKGYYKEPEKTAETIVDGWLHTGDCGFIDEDDCLHLTGRVKDTFKSSKGEFIVPSEIELMFSDNTDIEQLCLLGLGLPQPILLVYPSDLGLRKDQNQLNQSLTDTLNRVNKEVVNYKRVATIVLINKPFCVEDSTMTPTLKVKRNKVHEIYKDSLLKYFESSDLIIKE